MPLIILLVFFAVFGLIALLMTATGKPKTSKRTQATLASALGSFRSSTREEIIDVRKEHRLSSIVWLHNLLSRINLAVEVRRLLSQADLPWTTGKFLLISVALSIASGYLIGIRTHSSVTGLLLGLLAGSAPLIYVLRKRRTRLRQIQQKLPETLDLMISALRAGHGMSGAFGAAAREAPEPVGREFRLCFEEQNFGIDLRTAMDNLVGRVPIEDMRIVAIAMLIHKETGGNLAEVLDKVGHVIRERFRLQQQIQVHTAQGRLTGAVLMLLPVVIGVFLYITNPKYISLLFTRDLGHKLMAVAGVMNVIGLLIIRKIINIRI